VRHLAAAAQHLARGDAGDLGRGAAPVLLAGVFGIILRDLGGKVVLGRHGSAADQARENQEARDAPVAVAPTARFRHAAGAPDAAIRGIGLVVTVSSESSRNHRAPSGWCPLV
jgi:hypothetical protein